MAQISTFNNSHTYFDLIFTLGHEIMKHRLHAHSCSALVHLCRLKHLYIRNMCSYFTAYLVGKCQNLSVSYGLQGINTKVMIVVAVSRSCFQVLGRFEGCFFFSVKSEAKCYFLKFANIRRLLLKEAETVIKSHCSAAVSTKK